MYNSRNHSWKHKKGRCSACNQGRKKHVRVCVMSKWKCGDFHLILMGRAESKTDAEEGEGGEGRGAGQADEAEDAIFRCLLRKLGGLTVPGRGVLDIPLSYHPKFMKDSEADLLLSICHPALPTALTWRYPLLVRPSA